MPQAIKSHSELMTAIEAYYGRYESKFKKDLVYNFVRNNFQVDELDSVFSKLRQTFSSQYKTPPDELAFSSFKGSPEVKAEQAWADLMKYTTSYSILCADPVSQETIKSMGGWDEFCEYRAKENHWCRRDFFERYMNLQNSARNAAPEILKGFSETYYRKQIRRENVKLVGDQDRCKLLLDKVMLVRIEGVETGMKKIADVIKLQPGINNHGGL